MADHDFTTRDHATKVAPYGIYDLTANTGWVNVGTDHDTAVFAAESLRRWWRGAGAQAYPNADPIVDHCRCGWLEQLPLPSVQGRTGRAGRRDRPSDHRLPLPTRHLEMESR